MDDERDDITDDIRQDRKEVEALDLDTAEEDFESDASDGLTAKELLDDAEEDEEGESEDAEGAKVKAAGSGEDAEREIGRIDADHRKIGGSVTAVKPRRGGPRRKSARPKKGKRKSKA